MKIYGCLAIVSLNSSYLISPEFCALRKSQNVFAVYQESWGTHFNETPFCDNSQLYVPVYHSPFGKHGFIRVILSRRDVSSDLTVLFKDKKFPQWLLAMEPLYLADEMPVWYVLCVLLQPEFWEVFFPFLNSCFEDKERMFISPRASQGVPACQSSPAWENSIRPTSAGLNTHQVTGPSNEEEPKGTPSVDSFSLWYPGRDFRKVPCFY